MEGGTSDKMRQDSEAGRCIPRDEIALPTVVSFDVIYLVSILLVFLEETEWSSEEGFPMTKHL